MKAIFETGGKQYYVQEGDVIYVEKLNAEVGSTIDFTEVLCVGDKTGTPYVSGAKVTCEVEKHGKNKKIVVSSINQRRNIVIPEDIDSHILSLLLKRLLVNYDYSKEKR